MDHNENEHVLSRLPILILYPQNRCNCRCLMCDSWKSTDTAQWDVQDILRFLPEWQTLGVKQIAFSGGEPLLHPQLSEMCALLREAGMKVTILSNGLLLSREARTLAAYCDDYVLSLDGPPEVHNRIRRVPDAFNKLKEGIMTIKSENRHAYLIARCTVQQMNFRHLRETVQCAHTLGFNQVSFLAVDVSSQTFHSNSDKDNKRFRQLALSPADLKELQEEVISLEREYYDHFASGFIAESPEKLRRKIVQYFSALAGIADFAPIHCNAPWVSAVIEADGTVKPCFFQNIVLGNIFRNSLHDILNSQHAVMFRNSLDIARNPVCHSCVCTLYLQ